MIREIGYLPGTPFAVENLAVDDLRCGLVKISEIGGEWFTVPSPEEIQQLQKLNLQAHENSAFVAFSEARDEIDKLTSKTHHQAVEIDRLRKLVADSVQ